MFLILHNINYNFIYDYAVDTTTRLLGMDHFK